MINPYELERFYAEDRKQFKAIRCIYFFFKGKVIVYVGMTTNLRNRLLVHRGKKGYEKTMEIAYIQVDELSAKGAKSASVLAEEEVFASSSELYLDRVISLL